MYVQNLGQYLAANHPGCAGRAVCSYPTADEPVYSLEGWDKADGTAPTPEQVAAWTPPVPDPDAAPAKSISETTTRGEAKELRAQIAQARTAASEAGTIRATCAALDTLAATMDAILAKLAGE